MKKMEFDSFAWILEFLLDKSYLGNWLLFAGMLVGGTVVTTAGAFAAALGYFNVVHVGILAFLADVLNDVVYYAAARWGRFQFVEKYGHRIGLTKEGIARAEHYLTKHAAKGLFFSKFLPILPTLALFLAGAIRMPFQKFILIASIATIPRSILFTALGFYSGATYQNVARSIDRIELSLLLLFVAVVFLYYFYRRFSRAVARRIEQI